MGFSYRPIEIDNDEVPILDGSAKDFIDEITASFELPKEFVLPGQNRISALLDVSRTVVRRAERRAIACELDNSLAVAYLNRLSDLLWAMARWQEGESIKSRSV